MKYTIVLWIILFPLFATAQRTEYTHIPNPDPHIDSLARQVLTALEHTWTLGIDSTSDAVDIRKYNDFKSLFDLNATIYDNIDVHYQYKYESKKTRGGIIESRGNYIPDTIPKSFDKYAHDVALKVSKLVIDQIDTSNGNIDLSNSHNMIFEISRRVYATKKGKYVLPDTASFAGEVISSRTKMKFDKGDDSNSSRLKSDFENVVYKYQDTIYAFQFIETLRITMFYDNDTVRIRDIKAINVKNQYDSSLRDFDNDAILNSDKNLKSAGDFTANGLPDYDLDGVPDDSDKCWDTYGSRRNHGCPENYFITNNKLDGFVGFQMNSANINLPELNQLGYDLVDVLQSQKGMLKNPGLTGGLTAGINYSYYFGHGRRQNGISVGLTYSGFSADYELTEPIVYTFKSVDGAGDPYRRQIKIDSLKESITYHIFNVPVMYNFRWYYGKKKNNTGLRSWFNFKAGPSLMIFNTTSDYNAHISFGGLYQTDGQKIIYTDPFANGDTYNFFLTADSINAQNPNPGADTIFNQLRANADHYDFANNKNYVGTQKNSVRLAVAINLGFDMQQQINEVLAFKMGVHFVYAPLPARNEKYKPIDKTSDPFQSIYNSNAKSSYSAFGLNVGFVYRF